MTVTARLTPEQVGFYREHGYLAPLPGLGADETAAMRASLDAFEAAHGFSAGDIHMKGHLCFPWSHEAAARPEILDAVEDLIGPDILLFASKFWIKPPRTGRFVSWHQDSAYFGLDPHALAAVWIALTDSNRDNGCVRVMPGSHRGPAHWHRETPEEDNLLGRGQTIEGLDESKAVDLELREGEFSIHHERTAHGSLPNRTDSPRIGFALFYIPTSVRSTIGRRAATLVRGTDRFGHWDAEPVPQTDGDPAILEYMRAAQRRYHDPKYAQEAGAG